MKKDELVGWHHQLDGHVCEQTPGDVKNREVAVCCGSWGHRVGHNLVAEQQQQRIFQSQ